MMIVDDHEVVRDGMSALLAEKQLETVVKCARGTDAIDFLSTHPDSVDVVLLDVRMPDMDGFQTLAAIREINASIAVVMISSFENLTYIARAVSIGANDFVYKNVDINELAESIRLAAEGKTCPTRSVLGQVRQKMHGPIDTESLPADMPLTSREAQVLRHIGLGLSNREISCSLSISVETVKEHVQNVLRKLEAIDRTDAAVRAVRAGLA